MIIRCSFPKLHIFVRNFRALWRLYSLVRNSAMNYNVSLQTVLNSSFLTFSIPCVYFSVLPIYLPICFVLYISLAVLGDTYPCQIVYYIYKINMSPKIITILIVTLFLNFYFVKSNFHKTCNNISDCSKHQLCINGQCQCEPNSILWHGQRCLPRR